MAIKYMGILNRSPFWSTVIGGLITALVVSILLPFTFEFASKPKNIKLYFQDGYLGDKIILKFLANSSSQLANHSLTTILEHLGGRFFTDGKALLNPISYNIALPDEIQILENNPYHLKSNFGFHVFPLRVDNPALYPKAKIRGHILNLAFPRKNAEYDIYYMINTEYGPFPEIAPRPLESMTEDGNEKILQEVKNRWAKIYVQTVIE